MKRFQLACRCGSSVTLEDSRDSFINSGGARDEKGRTYVIEIRADEWLDRHQKCLIVGQMESLLGKASP